MHVIVHVHNISIVDQCIFLDSLLGTSLVNQTVGKYGLAKLARFSFPLGMLSRVNNWQ